MLHPIIPTYRAIVASAALFLAATPVLTPAARAQQPSTDAGPLLVSKASSSSSPHISPSNPLPSRWSARTSRR